MRASFLGRSFQFWKYRVSHGELLVRSPRDDAHPRNIDLMFFDVEYVDLPRFLPELEIHDPEEADMARAQERLGKQAELRTVTILKSHERRYMVVAAVMKVVESDMDIFDSPFE